MGLVDHNLIVTGAFTLGVLLNAYGRREDSFLFAVLGMGIMGVSIIYGVVSGVAWLVA
jgi:hypothetical protein